MSQKAPNNAYILADGRCIEIIDRLNSLDADGNREAMCRVYTEPGTLFDEPLPSTAVGIFVFRRGRNIRNDVVSEALIRQKAIKFDTEAGTVFHGILHDVAN